MKIIGHRGARGLAPENTIAGFKKALECKVDGVEFDVWTTGDGKIVLHHDRILYKNGSRLDIPNTDSSKLPSLATIDEALNAISDLPFMLDLKDFTVTPGMINLLKKINNKEFILITHRKKLIDELSKHIPPNRIMAGSIYRPLKTIRLANKKGLGAVGLHYLTFNPLAYWLAKHYGLGISLFTVNSRIYYKLVRLFRLDVDLLTDYPDRFKN